MDTSIEKVLKVHAKAKGFKNVEEFVAMFDNFKKEKNKHGRNTKKHKDLVKWQELDGSKRGLHKALKK